MIKFINPISIEQILSGHKTQTWRRGIKTARYTKDAVVDAVNAENDEIFAQIMITDIDVKNIAQATDHDAVQDGKIDKDDFITALHAIYDGITHDEPMTIITFRLIKAVLA